MGIWVRNQNKEVLVNCDNIQIGGNGMQIGGFKDSINEGCMLAEYSTKEKALEVLNMIQEHINNINYFGEIRCGTDYEGTIATPNQKVFQMPSDDEV